MQEQYAPSFAAGLSSFRNGFVTELTRNPNRSVTRASYPAQ
jgi:hypothetical protein